MKLKNIEEIATKKVPVWQVALLVVLLIAGYITTTLIPKKQSPNATKNESFGSALGVNTIKEAVKPLSDRIQKEAGVVLGLAQKQVQQTVEGIASQSASQAKEFVFDNTLGKVLQNINALPADQQELIKKAICK